jgi:ubiquitin-like 1-activating enzyme E1 B
VLKFRPDASVVAHHANVKSDTFDVSFFRRFDVVLNGLDNLEARKHVNRLCIAAEVPLVESGTTGYLGQVTSHKCRRVACFECAPKPAPKSHPICTLRDTPEKPVHCVAYAADLLFPRLFAPPRETNNKSDLDEEEAEESGAFERAEGESAVSFASRVYEYVFRAKIAALLTKEEMWAKRDRRPEPLPPLAELFPEMCGSSKEDTEEGGGEKEKGEKGETSASRASRERLSHSPFPPPSVSPDSACAALGLADAQTVWTVREAASVFVSSFARLLRREFDDDANGNAGGGVERFDKDDRLATEFVAAVASLRSTNYGIPRLSLFDAKGVAGNIVHAVATTNAIVGGLIVVECLKIVRENFKQREEEEEKSKPDASSGAPSASAPPSACVYTFVKQRATNNRLLEPIAPDAPNPECAACGSARLELVCDADVFTLGRLIDDALIKKLGMVAPEIEGETTTLFLQPEGLDEDETAQYARNRMTALAALPGGGAGDGATARVSDFAQKFEFDLLVTHRKREDWDEEEHPDGFELRGDRGAIDQSRNTNDGGEEEGARAPGPGGEAKAIAAKDSKGEDASDDDDVVIVDDDDVVVAVEPTPGGVGKKRPREEDREKPTQAGKTKTKSARRG